MYICSDLFWKCHFFSTKSHARRVSCDGVLFETLQADSGMDMPQQQMLGGGSGSSSMGGAMRPVSVPGGCVSLDGVKVVLLDIEGTTTPITFVYDVLFPYAR